MQLTGLVAFAKHLMFMNYILSQAYQSICDLLIVFSDHLSRNDNIHVRTLEYKSSLDEQLVLSNFVQHCVFSLKQDGE